MEAEHLRARVGRPELVAYDACPERPGGAKLRNLLEKIVVGVPEKRNARRDRIDGESGFSSRAQVRFGVGQGEGDLFEYGSPKSKSCSIAALQSRSTPSRP
jgi:hypothetical protein